MRTILSQNIDIIFTKPDDSPTTTVYNSITIMYLKFLRKYCIKAIFTYVLFWTFVPWCFNDCTF